MKFRRILRLEDRITPATALLPDLQILSSYLTGWTVNTTSAGGRELRYASSCANAGPGPLELRGTGTVLTNPDGSLRQVVNQRIYMSDGTFSDRQAGAFTYDPADGLLHIDGQLQGQLRLRPTDQSVGPIIALSPKTTFALFDAIHFDPSLPNSPATAVYTSPSNKKEGISVGWNDVYSSKLAGQSIDITGVPNGDYWLEVLADAQGAIQESNESNNVTRIPITLNNLPSVGFRVLAASPTGTVNGSVGSVTVNFNSPVNAATFTPQDVTLTGPGGAIPLIGVTALSSVQFRIDFPTITAVGAYIVTIGPNIASTKGPLLDQDNNGTGGQATDQFAALFSIAAPQLVATSPATTVYAPTYSLRVTYSKPMNSATFTASKIVSFTGPGGVDLLPQITGITPASAGPTSSIFTINFNQQSAVGAYTLVIEPTVQDPLGHTVDQNSDGVTNAADRYTATFAIAIANTVGPDAFGYTAAPSSPQSLELVGKPGAFTIVAGGDDLSIAVYLGANAFNFYGQSYTGNNQLFVSTNGLITFGGPNTAFNNDAFTSATLPTIAPLWDDWVPSAASPEVLGYFADDNFDNVPDRLIIEWNQVWHQPSTQSTLTFQASLELNTGATPGSVYFNYPDLDAGNTAYNNGASATVGVKSAGASKLVASFNSAANSLIGTGKAVVVSVPTVTSITRLDPPTVTDGEGEFLVTFSEPVTGVDKTNFQFATTGNIAGAFVLYVEGAPNSSQYEVKVRTGTGSGTVRLDLTDDDSIASSLGAKLGGAGASNGGFTSGETYSVAQPAPRVTNVLIGDGTAQRSMIGKATVVFDWPMKFAGAQSNAFSLVGPNGPVNVAVDLSASTSSNTVAKLTFSGSGTLNGSLGDGDYTLTVSSSQLSAGSVALNGDSVTHFRRRFGDADGNGLVDLIDYAAFRLAYARPSSIFDFDNSGLVDLADLSQFKLRYGVP